MSLSCVITIAGDGENGKPRNDRTGTVESFLVDNQHFYSKVLSHIKNCDKCNPVEALQFYLERRKTNLKFHGQTSRGLVILADRYKKLIQARGLYNTRVHDLIDEFRWRSGDLGILINYGKWWPIEHRFEAVRIIYRAYTDIKGIHIEKLWFYQTMTSEYQAMLHIIANDPKIEFSDEIQNLIGVAHVMTS